MAPAPSLQGPLAAAAPAVSRDPVRRARGAGVPLAGRGGRRHLVPVRGDGAGPGPR